QRLIVTLKSNPTTGYDWQVTEVDANVIRPARQDFKPASDPGRVGAPGQTVHEFEAVGTGTTNLRLVYVRPWEKDVEPQATFEVRVTVQ
ncbi:MAG: protease inhibitor I42 family protein, partial [Anaerolineae bacterium]